MDDDFLSEPAPSAGARHRADQPYRPDETPAEAHRGGDTTQLTTAPLSPRPSDDTSGAYAAHDTARVATLDDPPYGQPYSAPSAFNAESTSAFNAEPANAFNAEPTSAFNAEPAGQAPPRAYTAPRPGEPWAQEGGALPPGLTSAPPPAGGGQHTAYAPAQPRPRGKGRLVASLVAGALAIAVVSGGAGAAATVLLTDDTPLSSPVITRDVSSVSGSKAAPGTAEAAAATIAKSVVTLSVTGDDPRSGQSAQSTGSGVMMRKDGVILTNNHVVAAAGNGGTVTIHLPDGSTRPAKVIGTDPSNDLAVVKLDDASGLTAATFADSGALRIGQRVLAMGAPLGLRGTVTEGIISAVNRPVRTGDGNGQDAVIDAVQTDAAINPGNSGGPLVDMAGRVVGINSAIATVSGGNGQAGNIGVGFAIPANDAVKIAQQLITRGSADHATLGVSAQNAPGGTGAAIEQVQPDAPAAKAGLRAGDVVTAVGNRPVIDVDSLVVAIRDHQPGESVEITYKRGGQTAKAKATLSGKAG
jgi:putative serine protease PepD